MKIPFIHGWLTCLWLTSAASLLAANPYRILVTGDSISVGYTDNPNWTVPFDFGARSGLYTRLTNSGMAIQFVGNSPEPWDGKFGVPTNTPALDLRPLGQDHCEGYGGKKASFILSNIPAWLATEVPDIILLMIGINDIHADVAEPTATEQTLSNIVFTVTANAPNARLIVAQITPYGTNCPGIVKYNTYIREVLVPYFAAQGKFVTTVDQYTNMLFPGTTNIDGSLFANGINHPLPAVYDKMAQTWFDGIQALLPLPPPSDPPPSSSSRWSGAINGVWDTTTTNWAQPNTGIPTTYTDSTPGDAVQFDDTLAGNAAITLNATYTPASVIFSNNSAAYTVNGAGGIAGTTGIIKKGTGTVTLNTSNTFSGAVSNSAGTLELGGVNTFGVGTTLSGAAVIRVSKSGALGSGAIRIGLAQLDSAHVELTGGVTLVNSLAYRVRNSGAADLTGYFVNVSGTNILDPPADLAVGSGGDCLPLQSDTGRLVLTKGINNAGRYLILLGAGDGEIQGALGVNTWLRKCGTGTWTLSASSPTGGPTVVSNGTLIVNGSLTSATNALAIAGGTLGGTGTIAGPVIVLAAGTLSPGPSVGKLTLNNNLTLQGNVIMEIANNNGGLTNDFVTGIRTNTYGGILIVTNVGSSALMAGDSFQLFAATHFAGEFASIVYPPGYTFTNNLAGDGTITVLTVPSAPPNFAPGGLTNLPDGNFSLTATGVVGAPYRLWASTNVALQPVTDLWLLLTNGTIEASPFTVIDGAATNFLQRFYLFSTP